MRRLLLLLIPIGLAALHAEAKPAGMYSIEWLGGSYQELDTAGKPKGPVIRITQTPVQTSACTLDVRPSSKPVDRWFVSTVPDELKIRKNLSWSKPKDETYCAIGVVANLHIEFDHPGDYKFTVQVQFSTYRP